jgi:hypothetical protein
MAAWQPGTAVDIAAEQAIMDELQTRLSCSGSQQGWFIPSAFCCPWLCNWFALVSGSVDQLKQSPRQNPRPFAKVGVVLGWIVCVYADVIAQLRQLNLDDGFWMYLFKVARVEWQMGGGVQAACLSSGPALAASVALELRKARSAARFSTRLKKLGRQPYPVLLPPSYPVCDTGGALLQVLQPQVEQLLLRTRRGDSTKTGSQDPQLQSSPLPSRQGGEQALAMQAAL